MRMHTEEDKQQYFVNNLKSPVAFGILWDADLGMELLFGSTGGKHAEFGFGIGQMHFLTSHEEASLHTEDWTPWWETYFMP